MKTLRTSDLTLSRVVYVVCCGTIEKAIITKTPYAYYGVTNKRHMVFEIMYLDKNSSITFFDRFFLSDYSVTDCGSHYDNYVNALFSSYEDAFTYINTEEYKRRLNKHNENNDWFEDCMTRPYDSL